MQALARKETPAKEESKQTDHTFIHANKVVVVEVKRKPKSIRKE